MAKRYNRLEAIKYAWYFWDRVCHDGRVAQKNYPYAERAPGQQFSKIQPVSQEEDCTHFISCCVGRPNASLSANGVMTKFSGGGLPITSLFDDVYGQVGAPKMVKQLTDKLGAQFVGGKKFHDSQAASTRTMITTYLQMGDLLAWASKEDENKYEHMAILFGSTFIFCHTASRGVKDFSDVYYPKISLIKMPD